MDLHALLQGSKFELKDSERRIQRITDCVMTLISSLHISPSHFLLSLFHLHHTSLTFYNVLSHHSITFYIGITPDYAGARRVM